MTCEHFVKVVEEALDSLPREFRSRIRNVAVPVEDIRSPDAEPRGGSRWIHADSSSAASTDWRQITLLYDRLLGIQPSPVVELNRAVAIAMCEGPEQGLCLIDDLLAREHLSHYHLAHSARADLCRRLGRISEARASYEKALALASQEPDRRFLARRLAELK